MLQLNENEVGRGPSRRPLAPVTAPYSSVAYPAAPRPQGPRPPQPRIQPHVPAAPRTGAQQTPVVRRSKAEALRLADRLKRSVAAGALLTFGALSLAVGGHLVTSATNTSTSSQTSSSSTQSSSSPSSSSQSSGVSGFSAFGSSSASSSTGVS